MKNEAASQKILSLLSYSSDNSSFLRVDEIAFWAILKQSHVLR